MYAETHNPFPGDRAPGSSATSAALLAMAMRTRRARARVAMLFPTDLFHNSAWDMMLELFIAQAQGAHLCVKELILVSGESSTSALRRIDGLQAAGLTARRHDARDHRRIWIELTDKGRTAMVLLFEQFLGSGDNREDAAPKSFARQQ